MPELVRLYIRSVGAGFVLAAVFVGLLLWLDVAGLGRLVAASDIGWIAAGMLWVFNGIVFAGVQFGLRVMRLGRAGGGGPGRLGRLHPEPLALPVPARARGRAAGPQQPWGR